MKFAMPASAEEPKEFSVPFIVNDVPITFASPPQVLVSVTAVWMVGSFDTRPNSTFKVEVGPATTTEFPLKVSGYPGQGTVNGMTIQWFAFG
ncbi:MAG: hypothetical protein JO003_09280 [Candidatus Eremiobacteraeota bacterium]|nr:hypothetical protein [Candidatus Eremiobacteraeota bacterium]